MWFICAVALAILQAAGIVTGTVRDDSGGVLPGVTVRLSGDREYRTVTDQSGRFRIVDVAPGSFTIETTLSGFESDTSRITLQSGANVDVPLTIRVRRSKPGRAFEDVARRIAAEAGDGAVQCGSHSLSSAKTSITLEQLEAFVSCAREAVTAGRPFYVIVQSPGIDSRLYNGLFAARGGSAKHFSFDSGPCGNEFDCEPRYVVSECPAPTAKLKSYGPAIVCNSEVSHERKFLQ